MRSRGGALLAGHHNLPDPVVVAAFSASATELERGQEAEAALSNGQEQSVVEAQGQRSVSSAAVVMEDGSSASSQAAGGEPQRLDQEPLTAGIGELKIGPWIGALEAAGTTFSQELEAGAKEPTKSFGILIVFVLSTVCWVSELVLAKFWDHQAQEEAAEVADSRLFLHALSFVRYLMAWHVVFDHFACGGVLNRKQTSMVGEPLDVLARWGALAVPWFFMVSGFTNSYSKLVGPQEQRGQEEDFIHAMVKRALTWYPFYLIALIWCAVRLATTDAEDWAHFLAHTMSIHGLVWEDASFPFVRGDVWFSWLVVYLLQWAPMHSAIGDGSEQSKDTVIWTIFYTSFFIAIPSAILEWYWFAGFPLYAAAQMWPSFVFGQALAFWFVKNCLEERDVQVGPSAVVTRPVWVRKRVNEIPVFVRFGATISLLVFGIMFFTFSPYDPVPLFGKPVMPLIQKGFQLPLQGLMVVGLAAEIDPVAKLFARRPFRFTEKLALLTFVFQVPIYNTIKDLTGWSGMTWTFAGTLVAFTVVVHFGLERPYRKWRGNRERGERWKPMEESPKLFQK